MMPVISADENPHRPLPLRSADKTCVFYQKTFAQNLAILLI